MVEAKSYLCAIVLLLERVKRCSLYSNVWINRYVLWMRMNVQKRRNQASFSECHTVTRETSKDENGREGRQSDRRRHAEGLRGLWLKLMIHWGQNRHFWPLWLYGDPAPLGMTPIGTVASPSVGIESLFWLVQCFVSSRLYDDSNRSGCRTQSSLQQHVPHSVCACMCVYLLYICVCMCIHKHTNKHNPEHCPWVCSFFVG